jgi:putative MATE family efflux protein
VSPSPDPALRQQRARARNNLTEGSIPRHLARLAVPSALTNLMSYSTTLVDMIWLGRVSPQAIAAVATFNYFWFLFALLNQMVGNGSVSLIARSYGAGELEECRRLFGQTFVFKLVVAVAVAALGLSGQRLAFTLFGAVPQVLEQAVVYGTIMLAASPLMFSTFTLKTGMRAIGDMRMLFYISFATMMLNLALDPLLIFPRVNIGPFPALGLERALILPGAGLGVAGAAWGTVIAFGSVFTLALIVFLTGRTLITMRPRHFLSLSWATAWRITRIGAPPAFSDSLQHVANVFVGSAINTYGVTVFAAQGVNQILRRLVRVMIMGLNVSLIAMVGQNLGARRPRRAELSALHAFGVAATLLLLVGCAFYFGAPFIARVFVPASDPDSLATAEWVVRILRINCFVFLAFGLTRIARGPFQGSGYTKPPLWATLLGTFGIHLPLVLGGVYLLRLKDPVFIWWVEAAAYMVGAIFLFAIFRQGHWQRVKV